MYSEGKGIWLLLSTVLSQLPETSVVIALALVRLICSKGAGCSQAPCKSRTNWMKEMKCKLTCRG